MKIDYLIAHKTFILAFDELTQDNKYFKKFKVDKRLTQTEKKIVESLIFLRKNKTKEGLDLLNSLPTYNPFIDGIKELCIGHFYNNSTQLDKALSHFNNAASLLKGIKVDRFYFLSLTSSLICSFNLKDKLKFKSLFSEIKKVELSTPGMKANFLQVRACNEVLLDKNEEAIKTIDLIFSEYPENIENRHAYFMIIKMMAEFKIGKIDDFAANLERYKKLSGYKIKENYKYMLTLLNFIYNDQTIYLYERDFETTPLLYHELNIIKSLTTSEFKIAKESWTILNKINAKVYKDNFEYGGEYCLFSKAFDKVKNRFHINTEEDPFDYDSELNKLKSIKSKILYILNKSQTPISKERLIMLLWAEEITEKNFIRLTTQISRIRKDDDVNIAVKNGMYFISKKVS